jgi:hypothetical protein
MDISPPAGKPAPKEMDPDAMVAEAQEMVRSTLRPAERAGQLT